MRRRVLAVLGPTASGKSALGLALAERVRRRNHQLRLDGRLPRLRHRHRQGVRRRTARHSASPHRHRRSDGRLHRGAVCAGRRAAIRDMHARGRLPILVGGTGFYYRALTRGLFPGPGGRRAVRARLNRLPIGVASSACTDGCARRSARRPRASCRAIGCVSCGRSRSTSRPGGR